MYAIAFDLVIADLKKNYGESYHKAYFEIKIMLRQYGFYNAQGSVYLTENSNLANLYRTIDALKGIEWFKNSVRDIRVFRIEEWSDFTSEFK
jgi:virulence-associated protein VapD